MKTKRTLSKEQLYLLLFKAYCKAEDLRDLLNNNALTDDIEYSKVLDKYIEDNKNED